MAAKRAIAISSNLGDAHIRLASIAMDEHQPDDWPDVAERHLKRAREISPKDQRALRLLGHLYHLRRRDDEAITLLRAAGADYQAQEDLGEIHLSRDNLKDAFSCFAASQELRNHAIAQVENFEPRFGRDPTPCPGRAYAVRPLRRAA